MNHSRSRANHSSDSRCRVSHHVYAPCTGQFHASRNVLGAGQGLLWVSCLFLQIERELTIPRSSYLGFVRSSFCHSGTIMLLNNCLTNPRTLRQKCTTSRRVCLGLKLTATQKPTARPSTDGDSPHCMSNATVTCTNKAQVDFRVPHQYSADHLVDKPALS
jgi:hypothetical protein